MELSRKYARHECVSVKLFTVTDARLAYPRSGAKAGLHGVAAQLAQRVGCDPTPAARPVASDLLSGHDGGSIEPAVAFAHLAQCPVHGLPHEVAVVSGGFADQG